MPAELRVRRPHGLHQVALVERADELRDRLGVGLRREALAAGLEGFAQRPVILDDPVEHDLDAPARVLVRMRVVLAHAAVRRPAGVPDARRGLGAHGAGRAGQGRRALGDRGAQAGQVAHRADALEAPDAVQRDARGVIAAVLQGGQAVQQQRLGGTVADVSDDSAHARSPFDSMGERDGCAQPLAVQRTQAGLRAQR